MIDQPLPTEISEILKGLERPKVGGLICTDKAALAQQNGLLTDIIKQTMATVMAGKPIASVSLPVRIFEPRSSIQRIADLWSGAPLYLSKAASSTDPVERLMNVIAYSISSLNLCCK